MLLVKLSSICWPVYKALPQLKCHLFIQVSYYITPMLHPDIWEHSRNALVCGLCSLYFPRVFKCQCKTRLRHLYLSTIKNHSTKPKNFWIILNILAVSEKSSAHDRCLSANNERTTWVPTSITRTWAGWLPIGNCRNVRGLGKSMVAFRLFEKLRYSNERSTIFKSPYLE